MSTLFTLFPLVLLTGVYAAVVKLAAFLFRRTRLKWKHAFVFGPSILVVGGGLAFLNQRSGGSVPLIPAIPFGLVLLGVLGGWYFRFRATTSSGAQLGFKGGVLLGMVVYAMVFALGVIGFVVLPVLLQAVRQ